MPLTALDFQQARIKQVLFKSRLRSVLYGVREPDAALFDFSQNPLAQWLLTVARPRFGARPEVGALERAVQQQLNTGHDLVRQYQRGQMEEARGGLDKIDAAAAQIEQLLQRLEQQ
ncbi:hypothetical protein [uncultured Hymenobacter sp.]|uniref:hypothetical protein n=1 Tax=uncultured Hymenobacter sp. TaxID=170016 RepID=UPI0035CA3FC4